MGEAKRRGNQEQRIFEAIARNEAEKAAFKKIPPIQISRQRTLGRGIGRVGIGLAIALSALGTTAIEVHQHEN